MRPGPSLIAVLLAVLLAPTTAPAQEPMRPRPEARPVAPLRPAGTPGAALGLKLHGAPTPSDSDCLEGDYYDLVRALEAQGPTMLARWLEKRGRPFRYLARDEKSPWVLELVVELTYCKSYGAMAIEAEVRVRSTQDGGREAGSSGSAIRWEEDEPEPPTDPRLGPWSEDPRIHAFLSRVHAALELEVDRLLRQIPPQAPSAAPPVPGPAVAQPAAPARAAPPAPAVVQPVAPPPKVEKPEPRGPAPIVAVFDIQDDSKRYKPAQLQQLSEYLAGKLAEKGAFRVVPRDQLRSRLQQEKTQSYQQCYDMSCQIELGKAMAAERSLATKLLRFGNACSVSLTLYDLRSEASVGSATEDQRDCTEKELLEALRRAVGRLTAGR